MNYVHEAEIWRGQLKNEVESAAVWHDNWGFLAGRKQPPARGFSTNVAKYSYGAGQWSVKSVRVPDSSDEGMAAAKAEQDGRKLMSTLSWQTAPNKEVQPCAAKVRIFRSCSARVQARVLAGASKLPGRHPSHVACLLALRTLARVRCFAGLQFLWSSPSAVLPPGCSRIAGHSTREGREGGRGDAGGGDADACAQVPEPG